MAKETTRPKRVGMRRGVRGDSLLLRALRSPNVGWAVLIAVAFVGAASVLAAWSRQQPLVAVGRVMNDTAVTRVKFAVEDREGAEKSREIRRQETPRVYVLDASALESIHASVANLPKTIESVQDPAELAPELARQFRLTPESLAAIREEVSEGVVRAGWTRKTQELIAALTRRPLVDEKTFQRETQEGLNKQVELRAGSATFMVPRDYIVNIKDAAGLLEAMETAARVAGFTEPALSAVVSRLTTDPAATFHFDETATTERQNAQARQVLPAMREIPVGQVIFKRGDVLDQSQLDLYRAELRAFQDTASTWRVWARWLSVGGAVAAITAAGAGYLALFSPVIRSSPRRMTGMAALVLGAMVVACVGTALNPGLVGLTAVAPAVFAAVMIVIAYDQRIALAVGALLSLLICVALDQRMGMYALAIAGIGVAVWQLREVRDRRTLVRMGAVEAGTLAAGMLLVSMIDRPVVISAMWQTLTDAALAGTGGLLTGVVMLAILPAVERVYGVTTGLTLMDLRDPRHPLLRQLQQRAPGTYNHSLNVASISESAADAIGVNSLLTYVGALYHDIGKMNKPDYFVENQTGGPNKHDKLAPAMSLLVIVGHVKDGVALAQEFGLPASVVHFIEAHHGTTLVEYFYNRARKQAEEAARRRTDDAPPDEVEYRYPGPKPRTKEVAILMLADAVESATRTMAEPTPSRIDALVRALANRRLMDGQFDECDLTLRELQLIVDSISKSVASIYHGRVLYPSTSTLAGEEKRA